MACPAAYRQALRYQRLFFIAVNGHEAGPLPRIMLTADRQLRDRAPGSDQRRLPRPDQPTPSATDPGKGSRELAPRLISLAEVMDRVALKRTSIYELIKTRDFPAPVKIQRASRWVDIEISGWIRIQMSKR